MGLNYLGTKKINSLKLKTGLDIQRATTYSHGHKNLHLTGQEIRIWVTCGTEVQLLYYNTVSGEITPTPIYGESE